MTDRRIVVSVMLVLGTLFVASLVAIVRSTDLSEGTPNCVEIRRIRALPEPQRVEELGALYRDWLPYALGCD